MGVHPGCRCEQKPSDMRYVLLAQMTEGVREDQRVVDRPKEDAPQLQRAMLTALQVTAGSATAHALRKPRIFQSLLGRTSRCPAGHRSFERRPRGLKPRC